VSSITPGEPSALARLAALGNLLDHVPSPRRDRRAGRRGPLVRRQRTSLAEREAQAVFDIEATGAHPRFAARRIAVVRRALRWEIRPRQIAVGLLGTALWLAVAAWALLTSSLFALDNVDITGASRASLDQIVAYADLPAGAPLLVADMARSEARIEAVPWVANAEITRDWPQSWTIAITERVPVAAAAGPDGSWLLVDVHGRVTEQLVGVAAPAGLLQVTLDPMAGAPGATILAGQRDAVAVLSSLPPRLAAIVVAASVGPTGQVVMTLDAADGDDLTVRMGTATDFAAKVLSLVTLLDAGEVPAGSTIDVRVAGAPAVLRPDAALDPASPAPTNAAVTDPDA
jgi:cell division protein FtsQ